MAPLNKTLAINFVDAFLVLFVVTPLTIAYWNGVWDLLDIYLHVLDPLVDGILSISIGSLAWCVQVTAGHKIQIAVAGMAQCPFIILSRVYTALLGVAYIGLWRGQFMLLRLAIPELHDGWNIAMVLAAVFLLICVRGVCNMTAAPLNIETDETESYFLGQGVDRQTRSWCRLMGYFAFSVAIVGVLVTFVWSLLWHILDNQIMPHSAAYSAWASTFLGYGIVLLANCGQFEVAAISRRISIRILQILFDDLFLLFASFGVINVWRGVWTLIDVYFIPDDLILSNWVTAIVGLVGSIMLFAANTLLARNVCSDGDFKDGDLCLFANQYLTNFLDVHKTAPEVGNELQSVVTDSNLDDDSGKLNTRATLIGEARKGLDAKTMKPDATQTTDIQLDVRQRHFIN